MAKKKFGPGYIYLIHAVGTLYYKIGHAVDVVRRLWQVNNSSPHHCTLIHAIPVDCQTEGEHFWHSLFKTTRVKGEWFALTENQLALFVACSGDTVNMLHQQVYKENHLLFLSVMDESK